MGCSLNGRSNAPKTETNKTLIITPIKFVKENLHKMLEVYDLKDLIGEGTYGKVYLAYHKITNIPRAIKIINKRSMCDTKVRFKFINEISVLKVIDHPNIIKLYEFFEDLRNYYLVTDYLTGGELLDVIIKNKVVSEHDTAKYIKQVLESVSYLHSKNIVHRDIKLENLIFESSEPDALLKLIDFGTSVIRSPLRRMKTKRGTISYLAPEVFKNEYNEKCDTWSIGVIMYILLSGRMPFGGRNDEEITQCIQRGSFRVTGQEWVNISPSAIDLLSKFMDYNPHHRISAEDALRHEWFTIHTTKQVSKEQLASVLSNLTSFRATFKLQRAVMCFIASQLITQAEKRELSQLFKSIDVDDKGTINEKDLQAACVRVWGERIPPERIKQIIESVDINGNGLIDYTEFIIASINKEKLLSTERLEETFNLFDADGSGKITASELKEMIDIHDVEDSCWQQLINEVDSNGDGEVDLKEFKNMMLSIIN